MIADRLIIEGELRLDSVIVKQKFSFLNAKIDLLFVDTFKWPTNLDSVDINGFSFNYLENEKNPATWKTLLQLLNGSKFSISTYSCLENYYKNLGMTEVADKIFTDRKKRERTESSNFLEKTLNFLYEHFIGFGRAPGKAIIWSSFFIFIGYLVFSKQRLIPRNSKENVKTFHRLIYTLDVFLPVLNLKEDEYWHIYVKKPASKFYFNFPLFYYVFLKISGWILAIYLIFALTSLTG